MQFSGVCKSADRETPLTAQIQSMYLGLARSQALMRSRRIVPTCPTVGAVIAIIAVTLPAPGLAQTTPVKPPGFVRISGRVVSQNGQPMPANTVTVRMARIEPDGLLTDEKIAETDSHGGFTFLAAPNEHYRIYAKGDGVGHRRTVDTKSGKDANVGDVLFETCPPVCINPNASRTQSELVRTLKPERIIIEPQDAVYNPWRGLAAHQSTSTQENGPNHPADRMASWTPPTLENRAVWETWPMVEFFSHPLSVESFVGGKMKVIRVVHYDPKLTPWQIRDEVRTVWLGYVWLATRSIIWSEQNRWNIEAWGECEDGKRTSILMDGWIHAQVQDRQGKYWYIRTPEQ